MVTLRESWKKSGGLHKALLDIHRSDHEGSAADSTIKNKVGDAYELAAKPDIRSHMFWNWGLHNDALHAEISSRIANFGRNDSDGFSEQLYLYSYRRAKLAAAQPRRVLEVGCGLGAGLNFLSRLEPNTRFVGLDLADEAIQLANARFSRGDSLTYVQGDAEALPFADSDFDVVLNVESSHNYPNLRKFISEVARVVKPGGYFVHADLITDSANTALQRIRQDTSDVLEWQVEEDISEHVRAAIRKRMAPDSPFRREIRKQTPALARFFVEPLILNSFGLSFLQERYGVMSGLLSANFKKVFPVQMYRLTVAKRKSEGRLS